MDGDDLHRWLAGKPAIETDDDRAWLGYIGRLRAAGISFQRVRMLTDPLTDCLRWMLDTTDRNVDAGEDVRWIEQRHARELGMPGHDFYILDDGRVLTLRFDDTAVLTALESTTTRMNSPGTAPTGTRSGRTRYRTPDLPGTRNPEISRVYRLGASVAAIGVAGSK